MKRLKKITIPIIALISILACNLPAREQIPLPSEAQTAAALTVQALLVTPATAAATQQQAIIAVTSSPTVTATATSKATITPTYSVPVLTVKEQTNCRKGPGQDYEIVFTYLPKKQLMILGRYEPGNFWLVKSDESPTGQCWLWGEYAEVTGSYWVVPSVTPPPTSTKAPPQSPSIREWNFSCVGNEMTFIVSWDDRSDNETGYRIYRNGKAFIELPPNTTSFIDISILAAGESVEYYIEVYSLYGEANSPPMKMSC